ncbi:MAG: AAA family ATPase [Pyrinomonadaceae bacterium]
MAYGTLPLRRADLNQGIHPFVTISREAGAGGHRLAGALLTQLKALDRVPLFQNWQLMDQTLCHKILENPKLRVSLETLLTEELHSEVEDIVNSLLAGYTPQAQVMIEVFNTVRTMATFGKAIIVGRGAVCLTRDLPYGVHVRLVAAPSSRIRRIMELRRLSKKEAQGLVKKMDRERARLLKIYFSKDIHDPRLYDVTWNTDFVSLEEIASSVIGLIQSKANRLMGAA